MHSLSENKFLIRTKKHKLSVIFGRLFNKNHYPYNHSSLFNSPEEALSYIEKNKVVYHDIKETLLVRSPHREGKPYTKKGNLNERN